MAPSGSATNLLSLPEEVLREAFSWSEDPSSARALLGAFRDARQLLLDPIAAALFLMRCPVQQYDLALASCSSTCPGGAIAVARQVLRLLAAGPGSGGPYSAPAPLLQSILWLAAAQGDLPILETLLALPEPPDVNASEGRALLAALKGDCGAGGDAAPHLAALPLLLEGGASPCARELAVIRRAAKRPSRLPALTLLLRHCPPAERGAAHSAALLSATQAANPAGVELMLPLAAGAADFVRLVTLAASGGSPAVLKPLLSHHRMHWRNLVDPLTLAAAKGRTECVGLLLDHGADVHYDGDAALLGAVDGLTVAAVSEEDQRATVRLLLRRGATPTRSVLSAAGVAGRGVLQTLMEEAAAVAAANPIVID